LGHCTPEEGLDLSVEPLEIKLTGRGGQGLVVAAQLLGLAFFKAGLYPQCYSVFGGERRGAPVHGFLRVAEARLRLKCEVRRPHDLICADEALLDPAEVKRTLRPGGRLFLNTSRPQEAFPDLAEIHLHLFDAQAVSRAVGLGQIINTALVGAYAGLTGRPGLEPLLQAVAELVPARVEANQAAARRAFLEARGGG
jgi:2-oxoacid:acceptor oxidoreductase gamma subunit (pyruvate/2-ketoisovalerate family)